MSEISFVVSFLAHEYEQLQKDEGFLEDFFAGSAEKVKTDLVRPWLEQLMACRASGEHFKLPSDSNLKTILKDILYDEHGWTFPLLLLLRHFFPLSFPRGISLQSSIGCFEREIRSRDRFVSSRIKCFFVFFCLFQIKTHLDVELDDSVVMSSVNTNDDSQHSSNNPSLFSFQAFVDDIPFQFNQKYRTIHVVRTDIVLLLFRSLLSLVSPISTSTNTRRRLFERFFRER